VGSVDWFITIGKCIYSHGVRVVPKIPKSKGCIVFQDFVLLNITQYLWLK
jgi:hypothetical protein